MLKNTLIILLVVLFGASLAQAQAPAKKNNNTKVKKPSKTVWVLQDPNDGKTYPIDKPVPKGNKSYRIINQTNPNQRVSVFRIVRFARGAAGSPYTFQSNSFYVGTLKKGDGCNIKVLELTEDKKRYQPKKQMMFNVVMK